MGDLYLKLAKMGADAKALKKMNPTEKQLEDLRNGLLKIMERQESFNY